MKLTYNGVSSWTITVYRLDFDVDKGAIKPNNVGVILTEPRLKYDKGKMSIVLLYEFIVVGFLVSVVQGTVTYGSPYNVYGKKLRLIPDDFICRKGKLMGKGMLILVFYSGLTPDDFTCQWENH